MSKKDIEVEIVINLLQDWAKEIKKITMCANVFLFGSLVNRNHRHFIVSGAVESDIDILIEFDSNQVDAFARLECCSKLQNTVAELENSLCIALKRDFPKQPLLSILPVTQYDVYHCIHKGFDPKIYTHSIFKDLINNENESKHLNHFIDYKYLMENIELFAVARITQKIRNVFLKTNSYNERAINQYKSEETINNNFDTLPKEIMRTGALLRYVTAGGDTDPHNLAFRTDLEKGEEFIFKAVESLVHEDVRYNDLYEKLSARRFVRSDSPSLLPSDILLISEIMYDVMIQISQPSVREIIDKILAEDILSKKEKNDA